MAVLTRAALLLLLVALASPAPAADGLKLREQQIKAGLLYNFLKYTEWPPEQTASAMTVCIFGADPFEGGLKPMTQRTVNQRAIALRRIGNVQDAAACQLLFVNADEKSLWPGLKAFLDGKNVLTVSDFEGFAALGGMIEFAREGSHIVARLNIDATSRAGLRVEDRLLRLVTVVHEGRP